MREKNLEDAVRQTFDHYQWEVLRAYPGIAYDAARIYGNEIRERYQQIVRMRAMG